jgi:hypothetical protein
MNPTRSAPLRPRFRPVLGIGLLALVAVGCQSKGDVAGKVTFNGKPLVYGTVLLEGSDGPPVQAKIQGDGSYSARGLPVGEVRIAVNSPDPKSVGSHTRFKDPAKQPPPPPDVPGWFEIPQKYSTTTTSGLTRPITGGSNEVNIELK